MRDGEHGRPRVGEEQQEEDGEEARRPRGGEAAGELHGGDEHHAQAGTAAAAASPRAGGAWGRLEAGGLACTNSDLLGWSASEARSLVAVKDGFCVYQ